MAVDAVPGTVPPEPSRAFLTAVAGDIAGLELADVARRVAALVERHERWRNAECLNLLGAENVIGRGARRLLDSDLATRVTEGFPGAKDARRLNHVIDEIEAIVVALAQRLFRCAHVDWRPLSNTMANAVALSALARRGEVICVQSLAGGGNMSYHEVAIPGLQGLRVVDMPAAEHFGVDVEALAAVAETFRPSVLVVGGSRVLFPYPLRELRALADACGARLLYDAAHLAPLVAAGMFQDPFAEGADMVTTSTHKFLGGPVGGLVLSDDAELGAAALRLTHPAYLQTRDQNKTAALAVSLAEMLAFAPAYARATVDNARALARALEDAGFTMMAADRGYTDTHQIYVEARGLDPRGVQERCQEANILLKCTPASPTGGGAVRDVIRISVQEVTRRGLGPGEMAEIARLVRCAVDGADAARLRAEVAELVRGFPGVAFSFDPELGGGQRGD